MLPGGVSAALQRIPFRKSGLDRNEKRFRFYQKKSLVGNFGLHRDTVCITCSHYKVRHREEVDRRDRHTRLKWTEIMKLCDG
jgi:hypothetical protein